MFNQLMTVMMSEEPYMSSNTRFFHLLVLDVASYSMYVLELLSVAIIVFTTIVAFFKLFRHERYARVYLLHGQSIALTFKLGAEILRTVTATSIMDIIEVFLLIAIKACMVILIERELRSADEEEMHLIDHPEGQPLNLPKKDKKQHKVEINVIRSDSPKSDPESETAKLKAKISELQSKLNSIENNS